MINVHGVVPFDNELLLDTAGDAMERHNCVSVSDLRVVVVAVAVSSSSLNNNSSSGVIIGGYKQVPLYSGSDEINHRCKQRRVRFTVRFNPKKNV